MIIIEECSFFIEHIEHIRGQENTTDISNSTYIDQENTKFGELDYGKDK